MRADYQMLLIEQGDGVATITMNRPEVLNALNREMLLELGVAMEDAAGDEAVRCVVLAGAGRAFGAGQDLNTFAKMYASPEPIKVSGELAHYHRVLRAMRAAPKPVIAAVQGVAAGASCNLALACDLRVAADTARFRQAFSRIGLVPDAGGGFLLTRLVGLGKAMELAMLADDVTGPEAARIGLVNFCVPLADFPQTVRDVAWRLAHGPTTAYALIKEQLYRATESDLEAALALEGALQDRAINTADHREGVRAFLEKRPPRYTGT
jgi:2-(1,2-epoxy-1,2-dihydrophenyl)acetyl-CoA isomerase